MGIFVAGQPATAAQLNAINGYVLKTADQSVTSSTTLADDTHLSYAIPAAGTYIVDAYLFALSAADAAGDLNVGFTFPAGTLHFGGIGADFAITSGTIAQAAFSANLSAAPGTTFCTYGLSTNAMLIRVHGILIATASGTLRLQWAQAVSNGSASTLKAGSHMLVRQVA